MGKADNYFLKEKNLTELRHRKKIALFLDYDGTLVPIQRDPAKCFLPDDIKLQLQLLANSGHYYLTILSGRSLSDIKKMVGIKKINYGGNHGLDISGPDMRYTHPRALAVGPVIKRIKKLLSKNIEHIEGAWVEDKKFTLSFHYRSVIKEKITHAKKIFYDTLDRLPETKSLSVIKGKKVLEIVPDVSWNKGKAVLFILNKLRNNYSPVFIGDDQTDETAFKALHSKGITIRVGRSKRTSSEYYIKGHREVSQLLGQLLIS